MAAKSRARKSHKPSRSATPGGRTTDPTQASARYTAPTRPAVRFRPEWHKAVGAGSIVAGFALFFICRFNGWGIHDYGGHVWYLVGLGVAASGLWWFGAFDRAT
jgi:hypothetical protein